MLPRQADPLRSLTNLFFRMMRSAPVSTTMVIATAALSPDRVSRRRPRVEPVRSTAATGRCGRHWLQTRDQREPRLPDRPNRHMWPGPDSPRRFVASPARKRPSDALIRDLPSSRTRAVTATVGWHAGWPSSRPAPPTAGATELEPRRLVGHTASARRESRTGAGVTTGGVCRPRRGWGITLDVSRVASNISALLRRCCIK
jgi:hypothetical protein